MAWDVAESLAKAQQAIEARIVAAWTTTPIQFPGVLGLVDVSGGIISGPPPGAAWMKVDVITGETVPAAFCGNHGLNRTTGIIQMTIFAPRQKGLKELNELAGVAKSIFSRQQTGDGLRPMASSFTQLPDDRGQLAGMVRTPFEYYEEVTS